MCGARARAGLPGEVHRARLDAAGAPAGTGELRDRRDCACILYIYIYIYIYTDIFYVYIIIVPCILIAIYVLARKAPRRDRGRPLLGLGTPAPRLVGRLSALCLLEGRESLGASASAPSIVPVHVDTSQGKDTCVCKIKACTKKCYYQ